MFNNEYLAIENSRNGLLSAKSAGIWTLIVPSEHINEELFSEADFKVPFLEKHNLPYELIKILKPKH